MSTTDPTASARSERLAALERNIARQEEILVQLQRTHSGIDRYRLSREMERLDSEFDRVSNQLSSMLEHDRRDLDVRA